MKILHIGQLIGGLEVYIRNTIRYSDKDFEFVIIHGENDGSSPVTKNGRPVKEYKTALCRQPDPLKDLKALIRTVKIIRKEKPDIIHCHSAKGGFIGRIAGWLTGTKTFYTPHAFSFMSAQGKCKKAIYLTLERLAVLNSYLLACSESERQLGIQKAGYKEDRALAWSNSVPDIKKTNPPADTDWPYICYTGRPSYQKNTFFLVDVIDKVSKKYPDIKFYLLGVGYYSPDLNDLQKMIADYNLQETIVMKPWLSHEETMGYVMNAMFYLTVARYEGLPLAVIEAMSLGKAVVASDVTGNKDCVKDGYNGWLLPLDTELFANKVGDMISDSDKRREFGRNSRRLFETCFSIESRIGALNKIYSGK